MWDAMPGSADWLTLPYHSPMVLLLALLQGVLCCEQWCVAVGATPPIRVREEEERVEGGCWWGFLSWDATRRKEQVAAVCREGHDHGELLWTRGRQAGPFLPQEGHGMVRDWQWLCRTRTCHCFCSFTSWPRASAREQLGASGRFLKTGLAMLALFCSCYFGPPPASSPAKDSLCPSKGRPGSFYIGR